MKEVFTTGDVARVCKVSLRTAILWFDKGLLGGYRVPNSRYRRIPRENLIKFMREHNIPTNALESSQYKILIVDDDDAVIDVITEYLDKDKFEIKPARCGYDAGKLTASFHPDLILLDLRLPDINGIQVCQSIKGDPAFKNIKILATSGYSEEADKGRLRAAGVDGFIAKPFTKQQLEQKINKLLNIAAF